MYTVELVCIKFEKKETREKYTEDIHVLQSLTHRYKSKGDNECAQFDVIFVVSYYLVLCAKINVSCYI